MKKGRLTSFIDAVLAIIMTILVLDLPMPESPTCAGLWALRGTYFTYALTFFWIGSLWSSLNSLWEKAERINNRIVVLSLIMLFFCSFMPYASRLASLYPDSTAMQVFFGFFIIAITLSNYLLHLELERVNCDNQILREFVDQYRHDLTWDMAIKILGMVVTLMGWHSAMMISVIVSACMVNYKKYYNLRQWRRKNADIDNIDCSK